jgi:hypothetical protein
VGSLKMFIEETVIANLLEDVAVNKVFTLNIFEI